MFSAIRKAYYGGLRAGRAMPVYQPASANTFILKSPVNPYKGKNIILALIWESGGYEGTIKRLSSY